MQRPCEGGIAESWGRCEFGTYLEGILFLDGMNGSRKPSELVQSSCAVRIGRAAMARTSGVLSSEVDEPADGLVRRWHGWCQGRGGVTCRI